MPNHSSRDCSNIEMARSESHRPIASNRIPVKFRVHRLKAVSQPVEVRRGRCEFRSDGVLMGGLSRRNAPQLVEFFGPDSFRLAVPQAADAALPNPVSTATLASADLIGVPIGASPAICRIKPRASQTAVMGEISIFSADISAISEPFHATVHHMGRDEESADEPDTWVTIGTLALSLTEAVAAARERGRSGQAPAEVGMKGGSESEASNATGSGLPDRREPAAGRRRIRA